MPKFFCTGPATTISKPFDLPGGDLRYIKCKGIEKKWSVITFGCWQIAQSEGWGDACSPQAADAAIKAALEASNDGKCWWVYDYVRRSILGDKVS